MIPEKSLIIIGIILIEVGQLFYHAPSLINWLGKLPTALRKQTDIC